MFVNLNFLIYLSAPFPSSKFFFPLHLWLYFCFLNKIICTYIFIFHLYDICISCTWLTSPSMTITRPINVAANDIILLFLWLIFHCISAPHLFYLLLCLWTFRLFPPPVINYYKHLHISNMKKEPKLKPDNGYV